MERHERHAGWMEREKMLQPSNNAEGGLSDDRRMADGEWREDSGVGLGLGGRWKGMQSSSRYGE